MGRKKKTPEEKVNALITKDYSGKPLNESKFNLALEEFVEGEGMSEEEALFLLDQETLDNLDEFHPANDAYNFELVSLMREIQRRREKLTVEEGLALEHLVKNTTIKAIKKRTGVLVSDETLRSMKVTRLAGLISALFMLKTGTTKKQRSALLWRIAVRNEIKRPDLSIAAVSTINKMFGDNTPVRLDTSGGGGGLTIVVNNQALANAPLDAIEVSNG